MKKYQIIINNIRFKIIGEKINKSPEFYTVFARKMPYYIIRQRDRGQAEAKCLRPRPRLRPKFCPRGLNITGWTGDGGHRCDKCRVKGDGRGNEAKVERKRREEAVGEGRDEDVIGEADFATHPRRDLLPLKINNINYLTYCDLDF